MREVVEREGLRLGPTNPFELNVMNVQMSTPVSPSQPVATITASAIPLNASPISPPVRSRYELTRRMSRPLT